MTNRHRRTTTTEKIAYLSIAIIIAVTIALAALIANTYPAGTEPEVVTETVTATTTTTVTTPVAPCDGPECPPWPSLDY